MARKFSSYGPIDIDNHYYTPRTALIDLAYDELLGEDPLKGGHYMTVWAPRQTGKTWLMQQVAARIRQRGDFEVVMTTLQGAKDVVTPEQVFKVFVTLLRNRFNQDFPDITSGAEIPTLFSSRYFTKPVILILDEFDSLSEPIINQFANAFRTIYSERLNEEYRPPHEKSYQLHGLALIGVRSVLGIENVTGSPFNVQRSLHIPNLTQDEVTTMFRWYQQESGQIVEQDVVDQIFYETRGQPGLTSWLGELLTQRFNPPIEQPITQEIFEKTYAAAIKVLPNNNILNIVSKAKQPPYQEVVLELFKIDRKIPFTFDDRSLSYLYTNGVIDYQVEGETEYYTRFACPFIQKRLFNYFSNDLFTYLGGLHAPFEELSSIIDPQHLHLRNLMRLYERYLQKNGHWLFKDAPRRTTDLRIFEAVYHFNLFMFLSRFLESYGGRVTPEFPTGNGKLDLLIQHAGQRFGIEVKSFTDAYDYHKALLQAAHYAQQLGLTMITLLFFVETLDDENRRKYEVAYEDAATGVMVDPVFVATG